MGKTAKIKNILVSLLVVCALLLPIGASTTNAQAADGVEFSAAMYLDADRTEDNKIVDLGAVGSSLEGWEFSSSTMGSTDRYLGISIGNLSMDQNCQYRLVVEMAPILYINQNSDPALSGTTVSFERNNNLVVNTDGSYEPRTYSLSNLTYLIDKGTEGFTLGLPIRFDVNLWNKQNGGLLGDESEPLLHVYLQEKQGEGEWTTLQNCDVSLKQATVSGSLPTYAPSGSMYVVGGSGTATSSMGADDKLKMIFSRTTNTTFNGGYYDKELEVKVQLPSCTVDGKKYTVSYDEPAFLTSNGTSSFDSLYDEATGVLTLTAKGFYFANAHLFSLVFSAPAELKNVPGTYVLGGTVSVTSDGVAIVSNKAIAIKLDTDNQAILGTTSTNGAANVVDSDTVQPFGRLALNNTAAAENGSGLLQVALAFDIENTKTVATTTVNLMCDRTSPEITIWYTLVDRDGNSYANGQEFEITVANKHYSADPDAKIDEKHYQTFTRGELPTEHRDYYFKTFRYTIGNVPGQSYLYHTGATLAPYSAGTIWGYVTVSEVPQVMPKHVMEVYRVADDGSKTLFVNSEGASSWSASTKIDAGTSVSYGLDSAKASAQTVEAGDSVTIEGRVFVTKYPYSSNHCLNDMCLGLKLPVGVMVNEASVRATYAGGTLSVIGVECEPISGSENFWVIEFESGQKIGWYNESLDQVTNGSSLNFSIQLNTEKTISTQTISLRECVFAAGRDRVNSASGSYSSNAALDAYDLNGNGSVADNVACFNKNTVKAITFQAAPAQLEITDSLRNQEGETSSSLTIDSFADVLTYDLNLKCTEGGSASDFFYLIPISKAGFSFSDDFVSKCQVDLEMKGAVSVSSNGGTGMTVLYTTANVDSYADALALGDADWSESLPTGATYESVTALKVVADDDTIANGSESTISVPLGYAGVDLDYERMAGFQIQWSSRGYYHYEVGHNSSSGTRSTDGCTVTLTYTRQDPIVFTLTAAKGGQPQGQGASSSYSFELPQFILAQEYSVKQVEPHNVKLMGEDYDFSTATSAEANENFRVNVSVKKAKGDDVGSNPVAIEKGGEIIGEVAGGTAPEFTFTVENADALSDVVIERYVTLTLIGSNGVIVPVKISIARELAAAEPTTSAIVAGKLYSPFEGGDEATVSQDSAFTAQFVTEYVPANYKDRRIVFEKVPATGTAITMIDWTNAGEVKYCRYVMTEGDSGTVELSSFMKMGSASEKYAEPTTGEMVTERLLFIVDFPDSGEPIRDNELTLMKTIKTGADDTDPAALSFTTVTKRTFDISASESSVVQGESFDLTYSSTCSVNTDSRFTGRNLALVVTPAEGSALPATASLSVGGKRYYLNSQQIFVIPLKAVQAVESSGETVSMSFDSGDGSGANLVCDLWASATADGSMPMMGEMVAGPVEISVSPEGALSLRADGMTPGRVLRVDDLSSVSVAYQVQDANQVTLAVQRKVGSSYVTQTTVLESVDGKTAADAGQGVFKVGASGGTVKLRLSVQAPAGTYRVLFEATNASGETVEVPYNFIIVQ